MIFLQEFMAGELGAVEHGRVRACTSAGKRPTLTYVHQWLVLMDFHYFHIFTNCDCKLILIVVPKYYMWLIR